MFDSDELFVIDEPAWYLEPSGSPTTCLDYSPDGALITYSNQPGILFVASSYDGQIKRRLTQTFSTYPIVGCRFHPSEDRFLITACKDGFIFLFNFEKGDIVNQTRHLGSNLLSMNVDSFGEVFAIACADGSIRIYDLENLQRTKALVKMTSRVQTTQTTNIYSLAFHPEDSNILLAAGWNDRILFWDVRTGNSERSIAGPHIRGPGLDIHNNSIITASARDKKQIEIWDYGTCKKISDISPLPNEKEFIPTALKVARNGMDFVCGGSGSNRTQAFDYNKLQPIGQSASYSSPVCVVAASPFGSGFISGTEAGEMACHMIRLKPT